MKRSVLATAVIAVAIAMSGCGITDPDAALHGAARTTTVQRPQRHPTAAHRGVRGERALLARFARVWITYTFNTLSTQQRRLAALATGGLARELRRSAERGIIKNRKVLIDCTACGLGWKPFVAFDPLLPISIRLDQARVDCEPFATDQPLPDAASQDCLEHSTEEIALTEATVPVLRERRVVRDGSVQAQPAKPTVRQIEVNFIAEAPLRSYAEAIAD